MGLYKFLQQGGEMGELTRNFDWSKTSVGTPDTWPQSLRTTLSILLNSKFPMFLFWGPDHICFYNDSYRPSFGNNGKHPAALGMPGETVWPEIWKDIKPLINKVMKEGEATWSEDQLLPIYRNGGLEDVYWTFSYSPVMEESGNIAGVFVTCSETTEKVLLIKRLQASDRQFQNLVRQAPIGIVVLMGEEMRVEIVNDMYGRLIGRAPKELLGKNLFDIIPEAADPFRALLDKVRLTAEPLYLYDQQYAVLVNGEKKKGYINVVYQPYKELNGASTGVIALCQDITEQFIAKEQLLSSEERLRIALEAAGLGTFELNYSNPEDIITTERFNDIFDLDQNVPHTTIVKTIHPDDLPLRNIAYAEAIKTGKLFYEIRIHKKSGQINWVRINGKVMYNDTGKAEKLLGIVQDITRQKDIQQQKDNFIAMASHELKTPVTTIKAYVQIVQETLRKKGDEKEAAMISRLNVQVDRLTNLISDLLNITRINTGKLEYNKTEFDFNELVKEITEEMERTSEKHKLMFHLDKAVTVFSDRERISQVIINFISNAIKYSPGADLINVTTHSSKSEVTFCVQDFGIGISSLEHEKVFEQFYRVNNNKHQSFQGLGLGLYISAEIIKKEGGKIWVKSAEGEGAEFCFSLPLSHPDL